ncbi:MAG TPA: CYTH and CHAD domain-containing protein [Roseiarcus sp.]|nr:CYTH and CHAD domain-containing protein [Roseiarcus sp.]
MMNPERQPTEVELKFILSPDAERRLEKLPEFNPPRASGPTTRRLVSTYFDTADCDLARNGLSLRVRRDGDKRIQTVKSRGVNGAASSRGEWEQPLESDEPEIGLGSGTPIASALPYGAELAPVAVSDIVRTARLIHVGGSCVEAALDVGSIEAGDARMPVRELELELKDGSYGALYRLALALHASEPLRIDVVSKAARGYGLRYGRPAEAVEAEDVALDPGVAGADAVRIMIANALGHLLANRAPALAGNPEGIHQTRIAIRRLRSVLQLFRPHLEPHARSLFEAELRTLGRVIGEARDWDVFIGEFLPETARRSVDRELIEMLRRPARMRATAAHAESGRKLDEASYTSLVLGLAAWSEEVHALGDNRLSRPLRDLAPDLLDRLLRKAEKRGAHVHARSPATDLHPLRKSLKKLRYGVEFVAALYPDKEVEDYVKGLKRVLKAQGAVNDAAVAMRLAEELAGSQHPEFAPAIGALALAAEGASAKARRKFGKTWKALRNEAPFWR